MSVVFIQKRTHRAGAQTCLARLMKDPGMSRWKPVLLCSEPGWLSRECDHAGIPVVVQKFPSSRSILARWLLNGRWAAQVQTVLEARGIKARIVHANDHWEGLLGESLSKQLRTPSAIFLRAPGMTRSHYSNYHCDTYDFVSVVGDELHERVNGWNPDREHVLVHDGLCEEEFMFPKIKPAQFPARVLVIGSPLDWKGWADLTDALASLEPSGILDGITFEFTGARPDPQINDLKESRLSRCSLKFLGRVEEFRDLVRSHDFVINPSRMESFGMAALETLAAGVTLLSSRTGVIEQVIRQEEFLFQPHDPGSLASRLRHLIQHWNTCDAAITDCQSRIRDKFLISRVVKHLTGAYSALLK